MIDMMVAIAVIALLVGVAVFALFAELRHHDVPRKAVLDVPKLARPTMRRQCRTGGFTTSNPMPA